VFGKLLNLARRRRPRTPTPDSRRERVRPRLVRLDARDLPSSTIVLSNAVTINGTIGRDDIWVESNQGVLQVWVNSDSYLCLFATSLAVNAGGGDDEIFVSRLAAGTQTAINGGAGYDVIDVGLNGSLAQMPGTFTVDGDADGGTLACWDDASTTNGITYAVGETATGPYVSRTFGSSQFRASYSRITLLGLRTSQGSDNVNVESVPYSTEVEVRSNNGADWITICPTGKNLDRVRGRVSVFGGRSTATASDTLIIRDENNAFPDAYTLDTGSLTRVWMGGISFYEIESFGFYAGSGDNVITLDYDPFIYVDALVYAGAGNDTVIGGMADNIVYGGPGDDILLGNDGNDRLIGEDGRDMLVGGNGADYLDGGAGEDILIDGTTIYGNDLTALTSIMTEWRGTGRTYSQRANVINFAGVTGGFGLASTTVTNDASVDTLLGGSGQDWLWAMRSNPTPTQPLDSFPDWDGTLPERLNY
jgi:Ca2+-binding RTX toxin-like protein